MFSSDSSSSCPQSCLSGAHWWGRAGDWQRSRSGCRPWWTGNSAFIRPFFTACYSSPRLVSRNTTIVDVRAAVSLFVAAWAEFSRALLQKVADIEAICAGEIRQLVKLFSELILHEIEKILMEETSKDLLSCVSQSTVPLMQDLIFIGMLSLSLTHTIPHPSL